MLKVFPFLLALIILLAPFGFVLAALGAPCCDVGDCDAGEDCQCEPDCPDKEGICGPEGNVVLCPPTSIRSIDTLIENITNWIFYIALILAPLMILIGAFMYLTSAGDPNKVNKANSLIKWTIIGFAIILGGRAIVSLIRYLLGV